MKNKNIISIIVVTSALFFGCGSSGSSPVDDPAGDTSSETSNETSVQTVSGTEEVAGSTEEVAGSTEEDSCPNGILAFRVRYLSGYNGAGTFVSDLIEGEDTVYVYCHPRLPTSCTFNAYILNLITAEMLESHRYAYMEEEGFITFGIIECDEDGKCGWSTDETKVKTVSLSNDCIKMEY